MTRHSDKRIRQRMGIPKKAAESVERKSLIIKVDWMLMKGNNAVNDIRVFNGHLFLFADDNLVTVIKLEKHYKRLAKQ